MSDSAQNGTTNKKLYAVMAVMSFVAPIIINLLIYSVSGAYLGGRASRDVENRLTAHTDDIDDLKKQLERIRTRIEEVDHTGTRPVQILDERMKRMDMDVRSLIERFEKFRADIIDQRTPLSLLVAAIDKAVKDLQDIVRRHSGQLDDLNLKVNSLLATKK